MKTVMGLNHREWQDILMLIHKHQSKSHNGIMDKIINKSVVWSDINKLEDSVRKICFKFDMSLKKQETEILKKYTGQKAVREFRKLRTNLYKNETKRTRLQSQENKN